MKLFLLTSLIGLCACKTTLNLPQDMGYQVEITNELSQSRVGELIALEGSNLVVDIDGKLHLVEHQRIDQIVIPNLRAPGKTPVMLSVAAISAGIGIVVAASGDGAVVGIIGLAAGFGAWASSRSPREKYRFPLSAKHLDRLKNYCRYPQGLNPSQMKQLLSSYQQDDLIRE